MYVDEYGLNNSNSKKLNGSVGSFKNNGSTGKRGSLTSIDANRVAIKSI